MARISGKGYGRNNVVATGSDSGDQVSVNAWNDDKDAGGMLGFTSSTKTISSGAITPVDTVTVTAAEAGTTDNLDFITYSDTMENDILYLFADSGDTITVRNNQSPGAGQSAIITTSAASVTLSETVPLVLQRRSTTFYQIIENSISSFTASSTDTLTNKTLDSSTNTIHADSTHVQVRNSSGSTITKGSPVYISGFDVGTTNPEISLADSSVAGTMPCVGLVSADITNNSTGLVIASGQLTDLNTSTYTIGDTLYVSETTGTLTATKPTGTALIQNIAIVERVHSSNGVVHISAINRTNDLPNIPDGKIWIGNTSAVPTGVTLSGDVTVTNAGVTTVGTLNQNTTGTASNVTGTVAVANGGTGVTTKTGTGNVVLSTSPTLVTPALGTPASGILSGCTVIPMAQASGILPDANMPNLTGDITTVEGAVATTLSSTLNVIGTQQQWIPAGAWGTVTTNGAEFAELELATNDIMLQTFNFDTTTSEKIQFWWHPASNWNAGTVTFQTYWTAASGSGTFIATLAGHSLADSDAIDSAIGGTSATTTDTLITANDVHISPISSAVTINGATKNEPVLLQLSRDISDTLGVDAKLIGVKIIYTIDTATSS